MWRRHGAAARALEAAAGRPQAAAEAFDRRLREELRRHGEAFADLGSLVYRQVPIKKCPKAARNRGLEAVRWLFPVVFVGFSMVSGPFEGLLEASFKGFFLQVMGATSTAWNERTQEVWPFMKEISSDGDVSTVDAPLLHI